MSYLKKYTCIFILIILCINTYAIESLDDILVGGIYRMELLSGDILEGIVEEKNDTSLIIECQGKPYTFNTFLIHEYTLITPPRKKGAGKSQGITESEILTYNELLHRPHSVGKIQIRISNGSLYRGTVEEIDPETVKINIHGSVIPISRDIITQISTIVPETKKVLLKRESKISKKPKKVEGPFDTVYVLNPETDEYGKNLAPFIIVGKIQTDEPDGIRIVIPNGMLRELKRERILRVTRHTKPSYEQKIKTYAKTLFCSQDMILVDLPPGKEGRPFFRVCIDRYEYPDKKGVVPQSNISYNESQKACKTQGKRLCSVEEWQWACSGVEGYIYPYGHRLEKLYCNRDGIKNIEPSGSRHKCYGKFGVYDMVGNIFEWVTDSEGKPMLMGGPYSKCQTVSPGMNGAAKPQIGFRCCKSN